jgi:DNA-binding NarL/FixJ family response regulator
MGLKVLVAEPHDVLRIGLLAIFEKDERVSYTYEVTNEEDLYTHLSRHQLDLLVIDQSLVTEVTLFPRHKFVILAEKPSIEHLKATFRHDGRGYLSTNVSAELLCTMLSPAENSFLIEPTLVPWILEQIFGPEEMFLQEDLLTPREKEIVLLLREGNNYPTIAKKLGIAETTLRTHMKNISKKSDVNASHHIHSLFNINKKKTKLRHAIR